MMTLISQAICHSKGKKAAVVGDVGKVDAVTNSMLNIQVGNGIQTRWNQRFGQVGCMGHQSQQQPQFSYGWRKGSGGYLTIRWCPESIHFFHPRLLNPVGRGNITYAISTLRATRQNSEITNFVHLWQDGPLSASTPAHHQLATSNLQAKESFHLL